MKVYTIGFTKKNAEEFFTKLKQPGLVRVLDVRLNNVSQLAGFTKRDDLPFFLREINGIEYRHLPEFAPNKEIFTAYRDKKNDWITCGRQFEALMVARQIESVVARDLVDGGCLLCSEPSPERCHRRIVAEYLRDCWGDLEIEHL
jgi:uncharacterized protein (DUF488 family)